MKYFWTVVLALGFVLAVNAQVDRWQMAAKYDMDIDFDAETHRYTGKQTLTLQNNSPDNLGRVFYHLYFNAFQPGSMMDVRSQTIADADPRVGNRISKLSDTEIGYIKVKSLTLNGKPTNFEHVGTILEVQLPEKITAGSQAVLKMEYEAQVPLQIRRSGRNNKEGIDYSMTQWYPKMCEYDYQGWHSNPYIGREFHGIWGDFDVTIHIDKNYIIGGTGTLKNADEVGRGYEASGTNVAATSGPKQTWKFTAKNVHDFAWAADPDYKHVVVNPKEGPRMHFLYQETGDTDNWTQLPGIMEKAFAYINKRFGEYPYPQYTFIQGGDGGMEYPMATLITGERNLGSLVGVSVHELMHSWYQMMMGTNEALYAWMDEGFTSFASNEVMNYLAESGALPGAKVQADPQAGYLQGYINFAKSGAEEPLSTHADHFVRNQAYSVASYVKGAVFLQQLKYVIGDAAFDKGMLDYYNTWKFKHPNPNDFIRVMEKASGLELDWYREYMVHTLHQIDYRVKNLKPGKKKETTLVLERVGKFPMPVDVEVSLVNGDKHYYSIPLRIMRGAKPAGTMTNYTVAEDWPWVNPEYNLTLPFKMKAIKSIVVDPKSMTADVERANNRYDLGE